jgi:c-di-GMP-binding flagellar brake protein YcgR
MSTAQHEAPPRIALLSANDDRYQVRGRLEVLTLLRGLIAQHALVTAHGDGGGFFVTALLAVDERADRLVLDYGVDAALTERVLRSRSLVFVTQLDHVRIQFSADGMERVEHEGLAAFTVPIPATVTRLQRREHYRLRIPRGRPILCDVTLPAEGAAPEASPREAALPVFDLSCGGLSLVGWPDGHRPQPGLELPGARVRLADLGVLEADLRVVHVQGTIGRGAGVGRFGCRFVGQRPGDVMVIQRYINRIEREQRALL